MKTFVHLIGLSQRHILKFELRIFVADHLHSSVVVMGHRSANRKPLVLRSTGWLIAVVASLFSGSTAFATCGDYLANPLHTAVDTPSSTLARPLFFSDHAAPSLPMQNRHTGCESGQCKSVPVTPPVESTRLPPPKRLDLIVATRLSFAQLGHRFWDRSMNSRLPALPYLEVALRPPESM